jgi:hypothetical protein
VVESIDCLFFRRDRCRHTLQDQVGVQGCCRSRRCSFNSLAAPPEGRPRSRSCTTRSPWIEKAWAFLRSSWRCHQMSIAQQKGVLGLLAERSVGRCLFGLTVHLVVGLLLYPEA